MRVCCRNGKIDDQSQSGNGYYHMLLRHRDARLKSVIVKRAELLPAAGLRRRLSGHVAEPCARATEGDARPLRELEPSVLRSPSSVTACGAPSCSFASQPPSSKSSINSRQKVFKPMMFMLFTVCRLQVCRLSFFLYVIKLGLAAKSSMGGRIGQEIKNTHRSQPAGQLNPSVSLERRVRCPS